MCKSMSTYSRCWEDEQQEDEKQDDGVLLIVNFKDNAFFSHNLSIYEQVKNILNPKL